MILEGILILLLLATILLFFYRQAVKEFRISQTEAFEKVPQLLSERCPIVVYPFSPPRELWTYEDIQHRSGIFSIPIQVSPSEQDLVPLGNVIDQKTSTTFIQSKYSELIAHDVGLDIWVNHTLLPVFKQTMMAPLYSVVTQIRVGPQGLEQTYAYATVIIPTEGTLRVSLLTESADPFLPKVWNGKRLSQMTRDDTPFIGQIQTVEVIVRTGSALVVPAHWKVCWDDDTDNTKLSLAIWAEFHHPVSKFVKHIAKRRLHV
jgi:hypothetical protein